MTTEPMQIKIEFYGQLKDLFNGPSTTLECPSGSTVKSLFLLLCDAHQAHANPNTIKPIINDTFADWQQVIQATDVVGFFPPASGG